VRGGAARTVGRTGAGASAFESAALSVRRMVSVIVELQHASDGLENLDR
jgi:hypothetical protein